MENNKVMKTESASIKTKCECKSKQKKIVMIILDKAAKLTQGHHGNCFEMMRHAENIAE